jgi:hypothetical protein
MDLRSHAAVAASWSEPQRVTLLTAAQTAAALPSGYSRAWSSLMQLQLRYSTDCVLSGWQFQQLRRPATTPCCCSHNLLVISPQRKCSLSVQICSDCAV